MKNLNRTKKLTATLLALAIILSLAACASPVPTHHPESLKATAAHAALLSGTSGSGIITEEAAEELVRTHLNDPDATMVVTDADHFDDEYEFRVTTASGVYAAEVNKHTGKITDLDREYDRLPPATQAPEATILTIEEARELIRTHLNDPDAVFTESETERDDDEYEFEVISGNVCYDAEVNFRTGQITQLERDDDYAPSVSAPAAEPIGLEQAKALALAHLGDSTVRFVDGELDDGVYELEFRSGNWEYDYEVDACTGEILKAEKDFDD